MRKRLAIKGHPTRGNEVIELLEMMGGCSSVETYGLCENRCYSIKDNGWVIWNYIGPEEIDKYEIFTLEEFLDKYPFKVGDKVIDKADGCPGVVCEMKWDEDVSDMKYCVAFGNGIDFGWFANDSIEFCKENENLRETSVRDRDDILFDSTIWHLRNSINNGKQDISGGDCERYFRELVDKVNETNMNEKKIGTTKEPLKPKSNAVKLVDGKVVDNLDDVKTMEKMLAIKGHPTRGTEVIEILEMMGGKNNCDSPADNLGLCYLIDDEFDICAHYFGYEDGYEDGELNIFTLEEFLEKYPFKIGDIVDRNIDYVSCIIDDMRWNIEKCCVEYHLNYLNGGECGWRVVECLIKPKNLIVGTKIESTGFMQMGKTFAVIFNDANYEDEVELQLGDYEIEIRDGRTYAVKKKPVYPKTYKECCEKVNACLTVSISYDSNEDMLYNDEVDVTLLTLRKLLICQSAYWKVAGEEMGLDKSWEPKHDYDEEIFFIYCDRVNGINKGQGFPTENYVLTFPTKEMRDAFYENFKDLIESCKELL